MLAPKEQILVKGHEGASGSGGCSSTNSLSKCTTFIHKHFTIISTLQTRKLSKSRVSI